MSKCLNTIEINEFELDQLYTERDLFFSQIKDLEAKLAVAKESLRFIRSSCDCRNESESEQCAHVAEEALEKLKESRG